MFDVRNYGQPVLVCKLFCHIRTDYYSQTFNNHSTQSLVEA